MGGWIGPAARCLAAGLLLCLLGTEAKAQFTPLYSVASPAHVLFITHTVSRTITSAIVFPTVRLTCTVSCYVNFNISGTSITPATVLTGTFLLPNNPMEFIANRGGKISVIADPAAGNSVSLSNTRIHIQELAR